MEAATKTIQELSQRVLPDKPHHLAYYPEWRYKPQNDRHPDKPVEWHNTRLQYMTLLSDADRGVLLTRSCYDMVEELQKPVPKEVTALSKGTEKKKLSLSDYKNKKTVGTASASPPDPAISRRREADIAASAARDRASPRSVSDNRHQRPTNGTHHLERTPSQGSVDTKLPARPPTIHPLPRKPPSPEPRKRMPHPEDDSRPLKRTRPEPDRPDRPRPPPRDEPPRRREPPPNNAPPREARASSSSVLTNGGSRLKDTAVPLRNGSPASYAHSRNSSLNGIKSSQTNSSSNRNTPLKNEANAKPFVPPLLSPLRVNSENRTSEDRDRRLKKEPADRDRDRDDRPRERERERDRDRDRDRERERDRLREPERGPDRGRERDRERERQRDREREQDRDRKRDKDRERDRSIEATRPSKPVKVEVKSEKRPSPPPIPPLLDSTLKPEIEEAYRDWAKLHSASSEDEEENLPMRKKEKRKEPVVVKKRQLADISEDEDTKSAQRKSLIIRLRVPKRLRKDFGRIMRMSDVRQERHERQDRAQSPVRETARKRPAVPEEHVKEEPLASKRPRTSDIGGAYNREPPATPSKKGAIAMSRVSSSNSQVNTPGESYPTPANAEPNGGPGATKPPPVTRADREQAERFLAQETAFLAIGKQLKHAAQEKLRAEPNDQRQKDANNRYGCVKYLEAIIVFTLSFEAQSKARAVVQRGATPATWMAVMPMMTALQRDLSKLEDRARRTIQALMLLIQRAVIDEWTRLTIKSHEPDLVQLGKNIATKQAAMESLRAVMNEPGGRQDRPSDGGILKGVDIPVWLQIEDLCAAAIKVMGRWCEDEGVDWRPRNLKAEVK